jgi:predicted RNase H-like HicB family nuclease
MELIFEVRDAEGGFAARAIGEENIATHGQTWDELKANVLEAVRSYFGPGMTPRRVQLHYVRDELVSI